MNTTHTHIIIDGDAIAIRQSEAHEYLVTTKEVARGYGVTPAAIRNQQMRHADELIEGKHWAVTNCDTLGGEQSATLWTKRGVIRLGFFIRSERAKRFRDAAEDLILRISTGETVEVNRSDIEALKAGFASLAEAVRLLAATQATMAEQFARQQEQMQKVNATQEACFLQSLILEQQMAQPAVQMVKLADHLQVELERAMLAALGGMSCVTLRAGDLLEVARRNQLRLDQFLSTKLPEASLGIYLRRLQGRRLGAVAVQVRGENRHRRYVLTKS
jgi:prophage antirepressor-like protein